MLEARLDRAQTLKKIMEAIKDLVNEANFDCTSEGISLQAMDTSHVSLVSLNLNKAGFANFRCDHTVSLGITLASMAKVLKCGKDDDALTLRANPDGDVVSFLFESQNNDRMLDFELKLMDIDSEHLGIPDTEYKCNITMPAGEFQRICREIAIIGDTVTISVNKSSVTFSFEGDIGKGSIVLNEDTSADNQQGIKIDMEEEVSQTFALRYLNSFSKATPLSDTVTLRLSPDVPLVVEYNINSGSGKKKDDEPQEDESIGSLSYYLAPKIEEE